MQSYLRPLVSLFVVAATSAPAAAMAQGAAPPLPASQAGITKATDAKTEIADGKVAKAAQIPADNTDVTKLDLSAGGLFLSGNAKTFSLTSKGDFRLRRDIHQLSVAAAGNFGRAAVKKGDALAPTAENVQGLLRYDLFFLEKLAFYAQSQARYDRFQGLDLRLNIDPGLSYYFVTEKVTRFWVEAGYDLQYDVRADAFIAATPAGMPPPAKNSTLHNIRLFAGYEQQFLDSTSIIADFEWLQNVENAEVFRFVADLGVKAKVAKSLAVATTVTVRYENRPLPNVENTDTIGAVSLLYSVF